MDIIISMFIALSAGCITYSIWFACKRLRAYEDRQIEKHFDKIKRSAKEMDKITEGIHRYLQDYVDIMCDTCGRIEIVTREEAEEADDGYGVVSEQGCPSYMGCNGNMIIYTGRKNA